LVTFEGRWHKVTDAGIKPLPIQRPIPVWFGGSAEEVLRRVGHLGDGWLPLLGPDEKCRAAIEKIRSCAREAGRDPALIGIEGRMFAANRPTEEWVNEITAWKSLGATHLSINTMKAGFATPAAHIEGIRRFQSATAAHW
jgi:alkanesulfonate monooxygenase SsuD/methylene tetrahydromethanopterin reductase-like flavin-dependent oxidoreductase (luciferase family)